MGVLIDHISLIKSKLFFPQLLCAGMLWHPVLDAMTFPSVIQPPQAIVFEQFGQVMTLVSSGLKGHVRFADEQQGVVTNRLVVKTQPTRVAERLLSAINAACQCVEKIQLIYQSARFEYYVVTVNTSVTSLLIRNIQALPSVTLVQPDVLQLRHRLNLAAQHEITNQTLGSIVERFGLASKLQGEGVRIAIIDDGFDLSHPDFEQLSLGFAYDVDRRQLNYEPVESHDKHGTTLLGVIWGRSGLAPKSELIALRQTTQWTSETILAFFIAYKAGAHLINCSWQSEYLFQPIDDVVRDIAKFGRGGKGTPIIFSAGNRGKNIDQLETEASIEEVLLVGSLDDDSIARFSNIGENVDIYLPGAQVVTTRKGGGYQSVSGTSISAAIATGLVALMIENQPFVTREEIEFQFQCFNNGVDSRCLKYQ